MKFRSRASDGWKRPYAPHSRMARDVQLPCCKKEIGSIFGVGCGSGELAVGGVSSSGAGWVAGGRSFFRFGGGEWSFEFESGAA